MLSTNIRRQIYSDNKRYLKRKKKITSRKIRARIVKNSSRKIAESNILEYPHNNETFRK